MIIYWALISFCHFTELFSKKICLCVCPLRSPILHSQDFDVTSGRSARWQEGAALVEQGALRWGLYGSRVENIWAMTSELSPLRPWPWLNFRKLSLLSFSLFTSWFRFGTMHKKGNYYKLTTTREKMTLFCSSLVKIC